MIIEQSTSQTPPEIGMIGQPTPEVLVQALDAVKQDVQKAILRQELEQQAEQEQEVLEDIAEVA